MISARRRILVLALLLVAAVAGTAAPPADATDPGRWREARRSSIPIAYYQGVAADRSGKLYFDGVYTGLYRTDSLLREEAGTGNVIPADVLAVEGYNHIGDIAWDAREGGRVLLPLECYYPGRPNGGNTCGTGSIGVADPQTLAWRYHVKLDPAAIPKAMWAEVSPNGRLLWTSARDDLLAYDLRQIRAANAAPGGPRLQPVRRLDGAVPPSGVTGGAFVGSRLYLAGTEGETLMQVWSVDLRDGSRRLEIEREVVGESEGLVATDVLGGVLHWIITPFTLTGRPPTYPDNSLLSFAPRAGSRLRLRVEPRRAGAGQPTAFVFTVSRRVAGAFEPVEGARVRFAGKSARSDQDGEATIAATLARGKYRATATLAGAVPGRRTVGVR